MSRRRVAWRKRGLMLCMALLLAGSAASAPNLAGSALARSFHAALLRSDPAEGSVLAHSPRLIQLWFTEPVQLVEPSLTIYDPSGEPVAHGSVRSLNGEVSVPLNISAPGTYLVAWQVISLDTDPVSGSFAFSLDHPGGPWAGTVSSSVAPLGLWLQVLARVLHFLGYALSFGTLLFLVLILAPLKRPEQADLQEAIWRLVNGGILLLVVAEGVALLAQSASLGTHALWDATFLETVLGSSFGRAQALRLGAALLLWMLVGVARQGGRGTIYALLLPGVALALIDSVASHAITSSLAWLTLPVTAVHIAAMGIWLGGVITLLVLWRMKATESYRQELLKRFSPLALASLAELTLSGVLLAGLHLTRLEDLFTTTYGRVLSVKILALSLPLLFVLLSRRSGSSPLRWWRLEVLSLVGMLVLAATLAALPPPR